MSESQAKRIDKYLLEALITSGRICQVWQGRNEQTGETVFLEAMSSVITPNSQFLEAFKQNIETIRQLEQPHIAAYTEYGVAENGRPYTVMPPLQGNSLANLLNENKMDAVASLRLVQQLAHTLAATHTEGFIHKDLRPEMIFITEQGDPILLGLAFSAEGLPLTAVSNHATPTPEKLDYPSPEEQEGKRLSVQSNVYSLGILLYELLAHEKPHLPLSSWDIFERQHVPQPIPLEQKQPGLSSATHSVVKSMLWRQKWNRYQTMTELAEALAEAIAAEEAEPVVVLPKPWERVERRWLYGGGAAVVLLLLITVGWLLLRNRNAPALSVAEDESASTALPASASEQLDSDDAANVASSPEPTPSQAAAVVELPTDTPAISPTLPPTAVPTPTAVPPTPTATPLPVPDGMVLIPAGTFMMGAEDGQAIEAPVHEVSLSAYFLDQYEVSNAQYRACVEAGVCPQTSFPDAFTYPDYRDDPTYDDYPVVGVTWDQAFFYCNWADKRLPTEAEWEYAARGPENLLWPWGNSFDPALSAASAPDVQPVDSYPDGVSPFNIFNMAGNVAEWVLDVYDGNFYANSPAEDPLNRADGLDRIYRGGSFANPNESAYLTYRRYAQLRTFTDVDIGFRCAADVPEP